ncbi:putative FBD-associated F-box protein At5g50270 [Nymphaea colorata]|uniref:putative FBD-associated F-box protein At5g50270 n=1 Tax=Nymphaea colorata TaxID=210225 RepID=UPI00214F087B|nr:putative FBD-associated F-box protein At5g50270 [Nymphaea colorata]
MEEENCDRISDLPDDILACILSRLPTKDLVATSILSKRWKDAWLLVPGIVFVTWGRFRVKEQVLLSWQTTPIAKDSDQRRVQLHRRTPKLPSLINVVSTNLILTSCDEKDGKLLKSLKLTYCAIKVIHEQINNFRSLKTLELTCTTFSSDQFRRLLSGCRCLESLKMIKCSGFESFGALRVELQTLRSLEVACSVPVVTDTKHVSWSVEQPNAIHFGGYGGIGYGLIKFMSAFPCLKRITLCINTYFKVRCQISLTYTGNGGFYSLVELNLSMDLKLKTPSEMTLIACLLQNSPILQKLVMKTGLPICGQKLISAEDYWQNQKRFACHEHLKEVTINDFSDKVDMSFAKFMLSNSQALRQMKIKFCNLLNHREKLQIRDELASTWKASPRVALIFEKLGHNSVEASLGWSVVRIVSHLHHNP